MEREYAIVQVADGQTNIVERTPGFDSARAEKIMLPGGWQVWISGDKPGQETEDLRRRLRAAEEENRAKESFLSSMSHDIRTPMNAIVGMTALAKKHFDEKARVADALDKIETASAHLLSLINDVLDMSRINSGRMQIAEAPFALSDLLHELLTIVRPQMEQKKHTFVFKTGEIYYESLIGDALRLRQIYVNIINNAVKYTPDGGRITVTAGQEMDGEKCRLVFCCQDNGVGMTEEFLQRIFQPFERVNDMATARIEGTGLGMSIVKKLIEAMDGEIRIQSAPGQGTQVTISIPLRFEIADVSDTALRGKRLLIIEADEETLSLYSRYLGDSGAALTAVSTTAGAIAALTDAEYAGQCFDAAVIGKKVKETDSIFELAAYLKKTRPGMPVLLISEDNWSEIEYRANRSGIEYFIPLPFFRKSLINGLDKALHGSGGTADAFGSPDLTGKHILLVEDNDINREIACELLRATNAQVDTAVHGGEAVEKYLHSAAGYYDLILMDIQMPVMDGYEAVKRIRASGREDAPSVRIIAMTANAFAEDIAKARAAGMNGHLAKPIDIHQFMKTLRRIQ